MNVKSLMVGFFVAASLSGCQGMVPQGASPGFSPSEIVPSAAEKPSAEKNEDLDSPSLGDVSGNAPADTVAKDGPGFVSASGKLPEYAAADAKPQPGGVSALPAGVGGGEDAKTAFDFTLVGTAQPICLEPEPNISARSYFPRIHYLVRGDVGAVLLDGTEVPLSGCEVVTLRFQTGSGIKLRCQDVSVKADCSLFGSVKLRSGEKPKIYLLTLASQFDDCEDMESAHFPATNGMTFLQSSEKLSECGLPTINDSIFSHPNLKSKFVK